MDAQKLDIASRYFISFDLNPILYKFQGPYYP